MLATRIFSLPSRFGIHRGPKGLGNQTGRASVSDSTEVEKGIEHWKTVKNRPQNIPQQRLQPLPAARAWASSSVFWWLPLQRLHISCSLKTRPARMRTQATSQSPLMARAPLPKARQTLSRALPKPSKVLFPNNRDQIRPMRAVAGASGGLFAFNFLNFACHGATSC